MLGIFNSDSRRQRLHKKSPAGPLKNFLARPFPPATSRLDETGIVALDFETTGLKLKNDDILSYGLVQLNQLQIDLSSATHRLVKATGAMPERSVVVHHITDDENASGIELEQALAELLGRLQGKVLLAHYAKIESGFLDQACKRVYGCGIVLPVMDTLMIEQQKRGPGDPDPGALHLSTLCEHYNLPGYRLHDALADALSCAQVFMAQCAHIQTRHPLKLKQFLQFMP